MSRVGIAIAVLLVAAGVIRAAGADDANRPSMIASLGSPAQQDGQDVTAEPAAQDLTDDDLSPSPRRRAPAPSAVWTGLMTIGALGWIRRKRRRTHI